MSKPNLKLQKFSNMLKMLPEWKDIICYDKRNKYVYFHDISDSRRKAESTTYYSKFLYEFRAGRYGTGRVLSTIYEHHYEYCFKLTAHSLQVWQNGRCVYQTSKEYLKRKTLELRYKQYLRRKYKVEKIDFSIPKPFHRTYKDVLSHQAKSVANQVLPPEIAKEINKWDIVRKSPYSNSFYSSSDISWNHKPENSLRVSDHWNFYSQGAIHCKIPETTEYVAGEFQIRQYKNGFYHSIN